MPENLIKCIMKRLSGYSRRRFPEGHRPKNTHNSYVIIPKYFHYVYI